MEISELCGKTYGDRRCIEKGADSKALSEILGHSSVKITLDIYVHSNMEQKREYINQLTI